MYKRQACQRIIEHFHLETYFDGVYGAALDGSISTKKQVLEHVFKENGMKREDTILIGDTKFDAIGAKEAEISCIGVTLSLIHISLLIPMENYPTVRAEMPQSVKYLS